MIAQDQIPEKGPYFLSYTKNDPPKKTQKTKTLDLAVNNPKSIYSSP